MDPVQPCDALFLNGRWGLSGIFLWALYGRSRAGAAQDPETLPLFTHLKLPQCNRGAPVGGRIADFP